MENRLGTLGFGIREPFKNKNYALLFLALFFVFFALFALIPAWTVVGNTVATQLDIFTARDYAILVLLSSLSSLFITMQVYVMRRKRKIESVGGASTATAGGFGALFAGIAGTAFCASCLAPLFALVGIGFGGVALVLEYRFYLVAAVTLLLLLAIFLTARKINKVCISC